MSKSSWSQENARKPHCKFHHDQQCWRKKKTFAFLGRSSSQWRKTHFKLLRKLGRFLPWRQTQRRRSIEVPSTSSFPVSVSVRTPRYITREQPFTTIALFDCTFATYFQFVSLWTCDDVVPDSRLEWSSVLRVALLGWVGEKSLGIDCSGKSHWHTTTETWDKWSRIGELHVIAIDADIVLAVVWWQLCHVGLKGFDKDYF